MKPQHQDEVAEWLRRWTANPMCSARVGSNPIGVVLFLNGQLKPIIKIQFAYMKIKPINTGFRLLINIYWTL